MRTASWEINWETVVGSPMSLLESLSELMNNELNGRTAIITGASQGLGLAIARAYVSAGASVIICSRDVASLAEATRELTERAGGSARVVAEAADVSSESDGKWPLRHT